MSKTFDEFLDSQHSLKPKSLKLYRYAIQKFNRTAEEPFEKIYLDKKKGTQSFKQVIQEHE